MAKKYNSKWFRIAVEGDTTDGRAIQRHWIEQMAANFDPEKYGARIWLEHFRGILPDGPFKAYGDILAVKAEEVTIDGERKMALFGQIDPTADLVQMNQKRQKLYSSVEIDPNFASSGEAYLVGMAVTDSPASLGTSMLEFSAQHPDANPFSARKQRPENLFTAATEFTLEFQEVEEPGEGLVSRIRELFKQKNRSDDTRFANMEAAVEEVAGNTVDTLEKFRDEVAALREECRKFATQLAAARDQTAALEKKIDHTENPAGRRPAAAGGDGQALTDC
ncbi:GPO family capsid scaffolding protein [Microbulbifer discodermiae]|uniref:GPO family capsid scaffolding protein n=1 Tax=Microbulbifer sp. 2201CG32-9 TaxID=3232309 RepID=UPI00345BFE83